MRKVFFIFCKINDIDYSIVNFSQKVLANQFKGGRIGGEVLFNGEPPNEKTHHRDVAFVAQEDVHFRKFLKKIISLFCRFIYLAT